MTRDELLQIELPSLRNEMLEVKKCQHHVFIFELISTGAIIGFILPYIFTILEKIDFWPVLFFLTPMVILIPSQYLILDKAITINRICSYFKVLEDYIASQQNYIIPWETGCAKFRERNNELRPSDSLNPTQGPNSFYKLNFLITFIITIIVFSLMAIFYASSAKNNEAIFKDLFIMGLFSISIVITLVQQLIWLLRVLKGRYTILAMADLWSQIFKDYNA